MRLLPTADNVETTTEMSRPLSKGRRPIASCLLSALAGLSLSGCQVAHMALPQDLHSDTSELPVDGRFLLLFNDSFQFGPYRVTEVDRGWTVSDGYSLSIGEVDFSESEAEQSYGFSITEPDRPSRDVHCTTTADWSQLEFDSFLGGRSGMESLSNQQLVCTLTQNGGETPLKLAMALPASGIGGALQGVMMVGATRIDISGTHGLDATPLNVQTPTGYLFFLGGRPVGAVEVINTGTVWLHNSVTPETRSALAAASAVLLLYQDVKEIPEDIRNM